MCVCVCVSVCAWLCTLVSRKWNIKQRNKGTTDMNYNINQQKLYQQSYWSQN